MLAGLLLIAVVALLPGVARAQRSSPPLPDVADSMGACLVEKVGVPTRVFDIRTGYLIELFLPGDPAADQDVLAPWPTKDSVAFVQLTIEVPDPGADPSQRAVHIWHEGIPAYLVARNYGYFTFGIAVATSECLYGTLGLS